MDKGVLLGFAEIGSRIPSLQAADQQPVLRFDDPFVSLQLRAKKNVVGEFHQQNQTACQPYTEVEKRLGWHTACLIPRVPAHRGARAAGTDTRRSILSMAEFCS